MRILLAEYRKEYGETRLHATLSLFMDGEKPGVYELFVDTNHKAVSEGYPLYEYGRELIPIALSMREKVAGLREYIERSA